LLRRRYARVIVADINDEAGEIEAGRALNGTSLQVNVPIETSVKAMVDK